MKDIDFNTAGMLLLIVEKCAAVGPAVSSIQGEAGVLLAEINEAARQNLLERADERATMEAKERPARETNLKSLDEAEAEAEDESYVDEDPSGLSTAPTPNLRRG